MSSTRTNNSFFLGAVAAVALVAAMGALLLLAYNANPAQAAGDCSTNSGTTTCTYVSTGEDTFVVPEGVSSVDVEATGASGAAGDFYPLNGASPAPGGFGARVWGTLTGLTPGDTLYVEVGGAPTGGDTSDCGGRGSVDCIGGFNGGGNSSALSSGGAGGGASDVRTQPRTVPLASDDSRLIVAAGGGGGGAGGLCRGVLDPELQPLLGGAGGVAGGFLDSDGGDGEPCVVELGTLPYILSGGKGGKEGTQSAGGAGGAGGTDSEFHSGLDGESGILGQGGSGAPGGGGAPYGGGGGGGGYYGGGGGGGSADCQNDNACADFWSGAGGGGGGSSLVPTTGGSGPIITRNRPSIVISYKAVVVGEPPPTEQPQSKEECKKGGYEEFGFKNQGLCIKAVNHPSG